MGNWRASVLAANRLFFAVCISFGPAFVSGDEPPGKGADGGVGVQGFWLPESSLLSAETRAAFTADRTQATHNLALEPCPSMETASKEDARGVRKCEVDAFTASSFYVRLRERYPVAEDPKTTGGVQTEVFLPAEGVTSTNAHRVLINVHGGGFLLGWGINSVLESVPLASVARMKVVSVDYREAPEYQFPAASEDLAAVYRQLLKTYRPANIGIYGCSAGGLLTAEAVAWFQKEKLPLPGAIAMLCGAGTYWSDGDSGYFDRGIEGTHLLLQGSARNPYFANVKPNDPLAFPALSQSVLGKFPPSLLITATRDVALSSVVYTHSLLIAQGVEADLHVWEGLGHAFFYNPELPESREVYAVMTRFFDAHLGR